MREYMVMYHKLFMTEESYLCDQSFEKGSASVTDPRSIGTVTLPPTASLNG